MSAQRRRRWRIWQPLPVWAALLVGAASGALLTTAFQPLGWWPMALLATAGELWAIRGQKRRWALLIGLVTGIAFWLIHIEWITVYLGPVPLLALGGFMALWRGVGAVAIAAAYRHLERWLPRSTHGFLIPIGVAAIMVARETASATWPWGGFSWGRLGFSQGGTIMGDAVSWTSVSGLSFLLAVLSAMLLQLLVQRHGEVRRRVTIVAAALIGAVAIPAYPVAHDDTVRVGAVQGASEAGLLAEYERGDIMRQHHEASRMLEGEYDLVVLPENAGEWNPHLDPRSQMIMDEISMRTGAPLVIGGITGDAEEYFNSALVWEPGLGDTAIYHKRHPVPFAEYLPQRELFEPILDALGFLHLIPRDYAVDDTSANAFDFDTFSAGVAICFDIIDDRLMREMVVDHGATIILAPTNNADFGYGSSENIQQLAIAQVRAEELGRSVVNISTVGTSAMVLSDGSMVERLPQYEPGVMSYDLPTSTTLTPAARFGGIIDWAVPLLGFGLLGAAIVRNRSDRKAQ